MDKRIEILNQRNCGPQIAQEVRKENKKSLFERLNDWVNTIMPDRF